MSLTKETKWMCEHARDLERFSGRWVMFGVQDGVLSEGITLAQVLRLARKKKMHRKPFVFHVPSKDECLSFIPVLKTSAPTPR